MLFEYWYSNTYHYIPFNGEEAGWRILSLENDETIKIRKNSAIEKKLFDSSASNRWSKPTTLNTYLNSVYYENLNTVAQNQIQEKSFNVGKTGFTKVNLSATLKDEAATTTNSKIALLTVSEYIRGSTNSNCKVLNDYSNTASCYNSSLTHNWVSNIEQTSPSSRIWLLTPVTSFTYRLFIVETSGKLYYGDANSNYAVVPVLYLKSNTKLIGKGTETEPYEIVSH